MRATAQLTRMRGYGWTFDRAWKSLMDGDPPDWRKDFGIRGGRLTDSLEGELLQRQTEKWLRARFREAWENDPASARLREIGPVVSAMGREARGRSRRINEAA